MWFLGVSVLVLSDPICPIFSYCSRLVPRILLPGWCLPTPRLLPPFSFRYSSFLLILFSDRNKILCGWRSLRLMLLICGWRSRRQLSVALRYCTVATSIVGGGPFAVCYHVVGGGPIRQYSCSLLGAGPCAIVFVYCGWRSRRQNMRAERKIIESWVAVPSPSCHLLRVVVPTKKILFLFCGRLFVGGGPFALRV